MVESIGVLVLRRGLARSWLWAGLLIAVSVFRSNRNHFFLLTLLLMGFLVGNKIRYLPTGKFLKRSLPVDSPDEWQLLVFMFLRLIHLLLLLVPVHFHVIMMQMLMGIVGVNMIMVMMVIMIVPMAVMMMVVMGMRQQTTQASPQQSMWRLR